MAEALAQVKREFGRNAVILNTRAMTRGGLLGFGGKSFVEITAARQMADLPATIRRSTFSSGASPRRNNKGELPGKTRNVDEVAAIALPPTNSEPVGPSSDEVLSEVGSLKSLVLDLVRDTWRSRMSHMPEELFETYQDLIANAVAEQIAGQLIDRIRSDLSTEQLNDPQTVRATLAGLVETMVPTAGPIRLASGEGPTIIALIGPTGVGKTTTMAKLAANFCLREHRKVGLITIDMYRIAAVEQLKTYAQIIDVPLEIASTPDELKEAVARLNDCDVVLIDTAGRSQRDADKIKELRRFFDVVKPHEVHLVLSSAASRAVLMDTIDRFAILSADRVIFTKIDEAIGFGVILTCLEKANTRLSYVTTGQDVPDDIEVGNSRALAELILRDRFPQSAASSSLS